jgi:hypothetical protein
MINQKRALLRFLPSRILLTSCLLLITCLYAAAGTLRGRVTDTTGKIIPYASVLLKGTTTGTVANARGEYVLDIPDGKYVVICRHIGYRSAELAGNIVNGAVADISFRLVPQQYELTTRDVQTNQFLGSELMRKVIRQRPALEQELKNYTTDIYIKGQLRFRDVPDKILGMSVKTTNEFEDSIKNQIIYLSETYARYAVDSQGRSRTDVYATKVSGNNDTYGFNNPQVVSFYHNLISFGKSLNPRGFVSPLADNAFTYYKFRFAGSYTDGNRQISRIEVIPKYRFDPAFSGYINIVNDAWRLYSLDLQVLPDQQLELVDTLKIQQVFVPTGDEERTWVLKQQIIQPSTHFFGFHIAGNFVQVYDRYNLSPVFAKEYFNKTLIRYADSSNHRPLKYWDTLRPVPLLAEEKRDYRLKDSIETIEHSSRYLDSMDKASNHINYPLWIGWEQTITRERKNMRIVLPAILDAVQYNTVEGAVIQVSPELTKSLQHRSWHALYVNPNVRYGFSNGRFNAHLTTSYTWGKHSQQQVFLSGGKRIFQFNNDQPITPRGNTFSTLLYENNVMKIYQADFVQAEYSHGLKTGLTAKVVAMYENRSPLENTTSFKFFSYKDREFTPNYPVFAMQNIPRHQSMQLSTVITWQPGLQYIDHPLEREVLPGTRYPSVTLSYTQGVQGLFGSDVNFSKWKLQVRQDVPLQLFGLFRYHVGAGGFFNTRSVYSPDFNHYQGNQSTIANEYLNSFQALDFYALSNVDNLYNYGHVEWHLNGLLSNRIPVMRKLNWYFVTGSNALHINRQQYYYDVFVGVENILKILRIDIVRSYMHNSQGITYLKFSIPGILGNKDN